MAEPVAGAPQTKRSIFKRGQKAELFEDGQELDEQAELQGKLGDLLDVWAMERAGRDLAAAIWRPELRMAEVVLQKGKLLTHMGVTQGAKLYLFIEEAVYLLDRANLLLFLEQPADGASGKQHRPNTQQQQRQRLLSLAEAYELMLAAGVSMEQYLVFCKLLRAGYIVQRHPARWLVRVGEDLTQPWACWAHAPTAGTQGQQGGLASAAEQQPRQQQDAADFKSLPAAKRRKVNGGQPRAPANSWWLASSCQQHQQQQHSDGAHGGSTTADGSCGSISTSSNPWLSGLPNNFLDSLPRCQVLPDAVHRRRDQFMRMLPLQAIPLAELRPLGGATGGHNLLHYDVFTSNSRFSRKAPGNPAFVVSVTPRTRLPAPQILAAADAAADGIPVRFSAVEKGDIGNYGFAHVELRSILPS